MRKSLSFSDCNFASYDGEDFFIQRGSGSFCRSRRAESGESKRMTSSAAVLG